VSNSLSNRRSLDDIDVRQEESDLDRVAERRIEFATFTEGEYVESILIRRDRAIEILRELGEILNCMPETLRQGVLDKWSRSQRETATILAALRYWQREGLANGGHERAIADDIGRLEALSATEIDALCERINWAGSGTSNPTARDRT
jgi:hypothetical protein